MESKQIFLSLLVQFIVVIIVFIFAMQKNDKIIEHMLKTSPQETVQEWCKQSDFEKLQEMSCLKLGVKNEN